MSVCTINSVHDIDYEQVKSDLTKKLEKAQSDFEAAEELFCYWRNESDLMNQNIEKVISTEYDKIQYKSELLKDQLECKHESIKFHENVGHTHGGEIFKTYCTECEYEFETYQI
jgi:predicted nuclease with TOPRIM domain